MNSQKVRRGCDRDNQPLLSVEQTLVALINVANATSKIQTVSLDACLNCILATDVSATINVPGFDNSAMDGYAIALKPEQINTTGVLHFEITDRIPAGTVGNIVKSGCAARIFTGAPIPKGANTVIMQEQCELSADGEQIETWQPLLLNENIRPMGNDIVKDDVILSAGIQLKPEDIALVASVGISELKVFKKIKVGVFFTGNELVEPDQTLQSGQIFNSNRYALVALLNQLNCEVVNLGNVIDDFDHTCEALTKLSSHCDLLITTGGVSVGEEDYVKAAVQKLGQLDLWRINMKPGKPLAFGKVAGVPFIGLPGNPVSAMVTFMLFARPFIKKMQGISQYKNQPMPVKCNFDWHRANPRREFARVQIDFSTDPSSVNLYPQQGSDVLSSIVWADGLVEIPENTTFKKGKKLNYYPFNTLQS